MWMVTNTMQRFIYGRLDTNKYNFRIWKGNVSEIIRGTVCDMPDYNSHSHDNDGHSQSNYGYSHGNYGHSHY